MLVGIGFLATLTAAVASRFVRSDSDPQGDEIIARLARIEADLAKLAARSDRDSDGVGRTGA
jgi:hypothetical protein